jgi:spermidine synthase
METVDTLARHSGPRGEVVLRRRSGAGPDVEELIVNGVFAMDSTDTWTERRLAEVALTGRNYRRVLVGGLGLGYTAYQLLQGDVDHLDVVEIEECLVEWAHAGLTPTLAAVATDPRVTLHVADVTAVLAGLGRGPRGPWDAIVLDVDNGPDFLIHGANSTLYAEPSLAAAYAVLSAGGTLAIWCQGPAPDLQATLQRISATARPHIYQRDRQGRRLSYVIYTATKPCATDRAEQE